jgi:transposase-like protein
MKTLEALSRILVVCVYLLAAAAVILLRTPIDYPVYVMAAYGFSRGEDVYSWTEADYARAAEALGFSRYAPPYRYPPLAALLVLPGLSFPDRGMGIWVAAQALSALLTAEALARMARDPARRILIRLGVGLLPPFFVSLYAGQVNPLVTLGMILAVRWIDRGREGWGGLLLGLSLMLKPLALGPAALCLYEGRRKALAGMALGVALSLAAGLLAFGPPALGFLRLSLPTVVAPLSSARWYNRGQIPTEVGPMNRKPHSQNPPCPHCGATHVIQNGSKGGRPRWVCRNCGRSFGPTLGTAMDRWRATPTEVARTLLVVMRRGSLSAAEEITGHQVETIRRWLRAAARHAEALTEVRVHDRHLSEVEVDAFGSFVKKSVRRLEIRTPRRAGWARVGRVGDV